MPRHAVASACGVLLGLLLLAALPIKPSWLFAPVGARTGVAAPPPLLRAPRWEARSLRLALTPRPSPLRARAATPPPPHASRQQNPPLTLLLSFGAVAGWGLGRAVAGARPAPRRLPAVFATAGPEDPEEPLRDPEELNTAIVRVVTQSITKYSPSEDYEPPREVVLRVQAAVEDLEEGGAAEMSTLTEALVREVNMEVERLGGSPPAVGESIAVELETRAVEEILRFTGQPKYTPGDVSREVTRRLGALARRAQALSAAVREEVLAYTGKDHYAVGDLSKALDARVKAAVSSVTGKAGYEVGDLTQALRSVVQQEVETLTGKPYEVGDVSKALTQRLTQAATRFTGHSDYRPGDLTREAGRRLGDKVRAFTGKEDYQLGDFTKGVLGRLKSKGKGEDPR